MELLLRTVRLQIGWRRHLISIHNELEDIEIIIHYACTIVILSSARSYCIATKPGARAMHCIVLRVFNPTRRTFVLSSEMNHFSTNFRNLEILDFFFFFWPTANSCARFSKPETKSIKYTRWHEDSWKTDPNRAFIIFVHRWSDSFSQRF